MNKEVYQSLYVTISLFMEEKTKIPQTLIGRKYYPIDNSYCKYISGKNLGENPALAGSYNQTQKETIIVSEPYEDKCEWDFVGYDGNNRYNKIYTFVNVLYKNSIYRVLYYEYGFEPKEPNNFWYDYL